jgi:hypothetical protein
LIDHGATLIFHHAWEGVDEVRARAPFGPIREHVLLPRAGSITEADLRLTPRLGHDVLSQILASVPDDLLMHVPPGHVPAFPDAGANRAAYHEYFRIRLEEPRAWVDAAEQTRVAVIAEPQRPLAYRR